MEETVTGSDKKKTMEIKEQAELLQYRVEATLGHISSLEADMVHGSPHHVKLCVIRGHMERNLATIKNLREKME